jgi:AcrR family transcriptional regulator
MNRPTAAAPRKGRRSTATEGESTPPRSSATSPAAKPAPAPAVRGAYHHGALRPALIEAAESLLAERGLEGFSLREVARRSGVSPAAPAHHFGDAAGLLTAVATSAFDHLTAALEAGNARGGSDPLARLREQGVGYVDFALQYPGRFGLMFRPGLRVDEALQRSGQAAFRALERAVRDLFAVPDEKPLSSRQRHALLAIWSVVHGFANLALAGQLDGFAPEGGRKALLRKTLAPLLEQQLTALAGLADQLGTGNAGRKS